MCEDVQEIFQAQQKESVHCGILLPVGHAHQEEEIGLPEQSTGFHNSSQRIIITENR